jgi:hypothetical protein
MSNSWWVIPNSFSPWQKVYFENRASAVHDDCPDCKDKSLEVYPCPVCEARVSNIFTFTQCFTSCVTSKLWNAPAIPTSLLPLADKNVIFYNHPAGEERTAQLFRRQLVPAIKAGYHLHKRAFFYGKLVNILPQMRQYNFDQTGYSEMLVHPELITAARKLEQIPRLYIADTALMSQISENAKQLMYALLDSILDNDGQVVINTNSIKPVFLSEWGTNVARMIDKLDMKEPVWKR